MPDDAAVPPVSPAPITGLSHVQLVVPDLAACTAWWTTALGLEHLTATTPAPWWRSAIVRPGS